MKRFVPLNVLVPLLVGLGLSIALLVFTEVSLRRLEASAVDIHNSLEVRAGTYETLALVTDAETGQRGFFITGNREYLEPLAAASKRIDSSMNRLRAAVVRTGSLEQQELTGELFALANKRLSQIESTLALYNRSGRAAAIDLIETGLGKRTMDELRDVARRLLEAEALSMETTRVGWQHDIDVTRLGIQLLTAVTIALLLVIWVLAGREIGLQEKQRALLADNQRRLEAEVEARTAELSELSAHLQETTEHEKTKLAREIHDELGSLLVSTKMDVAWAQTRIAQAHPDVADRLSRALATLDDGVAVKRRFIESLRPTLLDNLGLGAAIEWQTNETCSRAGLECTLNLDDDLDLPPDTSIALYRIVQESLTNIVKYAKAKRVIVDLARGEAGLSLSIRDDGVGIAEGALHNRLSHGIIGMRQRVRALGGEFRVEGRPNEGTLVSVHIPLSALEHAAAGGK
jgi:signal transduction histidine kinase